MPIDRSNTNNSRPLKPTLATNRTAKTPVAPRLATSTAPTSTSQSSRAVYNNASSASKVNAVPPEDLSTPVKSFLNSNVTPRSSSRRSRVGVSSANSTPSSTPSATPSSMHPATHFDFGSKEAGHGLSALGIGSTNSAQSTSRPRSIVGGGSYNTTPTPRPPIGNVFNFASEVGGPRATSPKFFHANDARPQELAAPLKKAPIFFYANGKQDAESRALDMPSPPLSSAGRPNAESRFFRADSIPEARGNSPPSTISTSPEPWTNLSGMQNAPSLRPPSPSKENIHLSYRKGASQVIRPNLHSRSSALSIIPGHSHAQDGRHDQSQRRSSVASATARLNHGKSASLSSIDSVTSHKKVSLNDVTSIAPSPLHNENRAVSDGSLPESVASAPTPATEPLSALASPSPLSPTKPSEGKSALEQMNELAANARRERKVLDLEISNSSLLAINRQLEKEVRKQKVELRRFRRMSRAGRFSTDTAMTNPEAFSGIDAHELGDLSDMSEEDEMLDEDDPEYSSESSFDEGSMSPTALADRDAAHRFRDEKRLQLDLSKHRELLIDSQKMNQSLKRCLNWTEELIKDAQKALAYQVRVSDVKLGGRVLSSEDNPEAAGDEESKALLSPWTPTHRDSNPLDHTAIVDSERSERDSGVDLDGLKLLDSDLSHDIPSLGSPLGKTSSQLSQPPATHASGEIY